MKKLTVFLKQLGLKQILTVLLATVVLFVGTACSGNIQGARPDNPAVQMGGGNNPYKNGGDTNTNYNISPDPKVSGKATNSKADRADLNIFSNQLIANKETLYPGADKQLNRPEVEKALPKKTLEDFETSEPGGQIQRESDLGDRVQDRLGAVKQAVDKASEFLNEGADKALEGNENVDNPGLPFLKR
jgi:hypothetical protein